METFSEKSIIRACEDLSMDLDSEISFTRKSKITPGCHGAITAHVAGKATQTIAKLTASSRNFWEMDSDNIVAKKIMKYWLK